MSMTSGGAQRRVTTTMPKPDKPTVVRGWVGFSDGELHSYSPDYNGEIAFSEFYQSKAEARMSYGDIRRATLTIEPKARKRAQAK